MQERLLSWYQRIKLATECVCFDECVRVSLDPIRNRTASPVSPDARDYMDLLRPNGRWKLPAAQRGPVFTETGLTGRAICTNGEQRRRKAAGFHQPADDASPETCCSHCPFCSSSCSADHLCEDRTPRTHQHRHVTRAAGDARPDGRAEAKRISPGP